ncbi:hypothetical protein N7510_009635 [Penicillium lagena]|uniref:uncharacterized protein n=1 Tax=Penicillium lagena TaxID=94218 RepID=UPI00253FFE67|nr:uncharacterized protein N7510_009635 [Penicillium lagena]KAJ5604481.1 hypothetical protein N7510_009635 [Penicillium lagena]
MGELDGKVIIVTGAGAGFGKGLVGALTIEGAKIVAVDLNDENVKATAAAASPKSCVAHTADVSLESSWRDILKTALDTFGKVDTVVNCAGVLHDIVPSHEASEDVFDLMFRVNVKPIHWTTRVIIPYWLSGNIRGHVINFGSSSEYRPRAGLLWYAASKGTITTATKALALEYAKSGIRFNCIRPVVGETGMMLKVMGGEDTPEARQRLCSTIPLGRPCQPRDISNMVTFLASDKAEFLTGITMDVDGGRGVA